LISMGVKWLASFLTTDRWRHFPSSRVRIFIDLFRFIYALSLLIAFFLVPFLVNNFLFVLQLAVISLFPRLPGY